MSKMVNLVLRAVGMAMGIAVVVLSIINKAPTNEAIMMLAIGVSCLGIASLSKEKENEN